VGAARNASITASGPAVQADLKEILIKGKRLDVEAALAERSSAFTRVFDALWTRVNALMARAPQDEVGVMERFTASQGDGYRSPPPLILPRKGRFRAH
jgi:hypothetical protein